MLEGARCQLLLLESWYACVIQGFFTAVPMVTVEHYSRGFYQLIESVVLYAEKSHFVECNSDRGRGGAVFM